MSRETRRAPRKAGVDALEVAGKLPWWLWLGILVVVLVVVGLLWAALTSTALGLLVLVSAAVTALVLIRKGADWRYIALAIVGFILGLIGTVMFLLGLGLTGWHIALWALGLGALGASGFRIYHTRRE
jgi:hypothetical protein